MHAQSQLSALGHAKHSRPFVKKKKSLDWQTYSRIGKAMKKMQWIPNAILSTHHTFDILMFIYLLVSKFLYALRALSFQMNTVLKIQMKIFKEGRWVKRGTFNQLSPFQVLNRPLKPLKSICSLLFLRIFVWKSFYKLFSKHLWQILFLINSVLWAL